MPRPTLDACLIVKNEETNLPRCLESLDLLRPLLESIHVYDTGSTDATVAIARESGCHVVEGYWDADFARARNASLAMSDAEWALIIDADDEVQTDGSALAEALGRFTAMDVLTGTVLHVDEAGTPQSTSTCIKVVRRNRVAFDGRVHEVARRTDGTTTHTALLARDDLHMRHWGYSSPELRRLKGERNLRSAHSDVVAARASSDQALLAAALHHEGRTLSLLRRHEDAANVLVEAFDLVAPGEWRWCEIATQLVGALTASSRHTEAARVTARVAQVDECTMLARVLLSDVVATTGDDRGAYQLLEAVPDEGDRAQGVEPNAVAARRLRLARAIGAQDEVLARLLVAVGQRGVHDLAPTLVAVWDDQPPEVLADLLRDACPIDALASLRRSLARAGGAGPHAAARL